jgi:hypothetical protein
MPPRPLDALAHALAASTDLEGAVVALADGVAGLERTAAVALFRHDGTRGLLVERQARLEAVWLLRGGGR